LAVAASEHGAQFVLITSMAVPGTSKSRGRPATSPAPDQYVDNVLASPQGAITGEKFERFDVAFVGAGDTLSAGLAALRAAGSELHEAVGEALAFLDQSLDAGFRPGMGNVVPDRFFWAVPPDDMDMVDGDGGPDGEGSPEGGASSAKAGDALPPKGPRQMH
jgi:hydroxymethylpyrimidine/phosphomethylpyrimidine kinase